MNLGTKDLIDAVARAKDYEAQRLWRNAAAAWQSAAERAHLENMRAISDICWLNALACEALCEEIARLAPPRNP